MSFCKPSNNLPANLLSLMWRTKCNAPSLMAYLFDVRVKNPVPCKFAQKTFLFFAFVR